MKNYKYNPGTRPTPLLMYETHPDKKIYDNLEGVNNWGKYTNKYQHFWNIGCYLIVKGTTVINYKIDNFPQLIYLLRTINLELELLLPEALSIEFSDFFVHDNELELID